MTEVVVWEATYADASSIIDPLGPVPVTPGDGRFHFEIDPLAAVVHDNLTGVDVLLRRDAFERALRTDIFTGNIPLSWLLRWPNAFDHLGSLAPFLPAGYRISPKVKLTFEEISIDDPPKHTRWFQNGTDTILTENIPGPSGVEIEIVPRESYPSSAFPRVQPVAATETEEPPEAEPTTDPTINPSKDPQWT